MHRILAITFALLASVGWLAGPVCAAITKGPYLQDLEGGSVTVMWETDTACTGEVHYGPAPWTDNIITGPAATIHEIRLTGLAEASAYTYYVESDLDISSQYSFTTGSSTSDHFRFVAFGDSRSHPSMVSTISSLVGGLVPRPLFALHMGDINIDGRIASLWDTEFFTPQNPMMASLPVFFALGNHEYDSPNYYSFLALPGNERWYSFTNGNAAFIALDTNSPTDPGSPQYVWLEDTLQQYAGLTWRFVFFHHPPYCTGGVGSDYTVRANLQPLFERYRVSMVFSGHVHAYEHSEVDGISYIVTGGYGAPRNLQTSYSPYSRYFASSFHFCVIDINGNEMELRVIDSSGGVLESITKTIGAPPTSAITSPVQDETIVSPTYTVTGTADASAPNEVVKKVLVSTDDGLTWHDASGTTSWSYTWNVRAGTGRYTILSKAVDSAGSTENPGAGISVNGSRPDSSELHHFNWDPSLSGGSCARCHVSSATFLAPGYMRESYFCLACHNATSRAHGQKYAGGPDGCLLGNVTASTANVKRPSYGNVTAGEYNNRPASRLKDGSKVACTTCHNIMRKTDDFGRVWEPASTHDNLTYTLQWGAWASTGYLVPRVYRDTSLWTGPALSKDKKNYLVSPSEYTFNEYSGTVTFNSAQSSSTYVYVTLDYPYLRASFKDNALCLDCHTNSSHKDLNCLACHQSHGSRNLANIRGEIRTPDLMAGNVVFLNRTGENSFAGGGTAHEGICEVCHTQTKYYRRDGTGLVNHSSTGVNYDRRDCTTCHSHLNGFSPL